MLYLAIFLVMLPITLPMGAREIADLLKRDGVRITRAMKVAYIVFMTLCCAAYVPAGVYAAKEWDGILAVLYFIMGFFMLVIPIAHEEDSSETED
jgi:uncharacterized membrane protein